MPNSSTQGAHEVVRRRRVLFALGDAVEKLLRLRGILHRQRAFVEARGKKPEYAGVIDPLLGTLDEQIELLSVNSGRIGRFLWNKPLHPVENAALPGILQKVTDVVLGLHELLILLPREAVEPQAFYLLKDCFEDEWNESSIVATNALEAYEYRVEDVLQNLKDLGQHGVRRWRMRRGRFAAVLCGGTGPRTKGLGRRMTSRLNGYRRSLPILSLHVFWDRLPRCQS